MAQKLAWGATDQESDEQMVDGDIFREIDEELKREQFARHWDKYGTLILGAALAIVLSVAGFKYWKRQQAQEAQTYGSRFMDALDLSSAGKKDLAELSFSQIAKEGPKGYAMLSNMQEAALKASAGKLDEARQQYDELAKSTSVDPVFKDFSRIQAAMLRVDKADEAEMKTRLESLANGTSSWRHSARELLGLSAFKAGNLKGAENHYNQIMGDRSAPIGIKRRAEMMLSMIVEKWAEKQKNTVADAKMPPNVRNFKIPAQSKSQKSKGK